VLERLHLVTKWPRANEGGIAAIPAPVPSLPISTDNALDETVVTRVAVVTPTDDDDDDDRPRQPRIHTISRKTYENYDDGE
jgi:hypothetical protein